MAELSDAKKELLALIKEQRERLDPKVLAQARRAIEEQMKANNKNTAEPVTEEPYDKENASQTIRLFLKNHPDARIFERALVKRIHEENN